MTQPNITPVQFKGARGTISAITSQGSLIKYNSDQAGTTLPFITRSDQNTSTQPQVADTSDFHSVFISYGQSWRSHALPVDFAGLKLDSFGEEHFAFAPQISNGSDLLPQIGMPFFTNQYGDLRALNWKNTQNSLPANASGSIGLVSARTYVNLCKRANYPRYPVIDCGTAFPGYIWDQLKPGTEPWTATVQAAAKIKEINTVYGKKTRWLGVGWTHGAFSNVDTYDYYNNLQAMVNAFDGLALNNFAGGTGDPADPAAGTFGVLHYYIDMYAGTSTMTQQFANTLRQKDFGVSDFGRIHLVGPRYPYPLSDDIHHTGLGYAQYGELEGLAKFYTHVYGFVWNPLYIVSATVNSSVVTLTLSSAMPEFGALKLDTKQIEQAPQYGFHVRVGGAERTVSSVNIVNANTIQLALTQSITNGTSVEVSYAWYGPGSSDGIHVGVWGNVKREGPPSIWFQNKTVDTWLCNYKANITAS